MKTSAMPFTASTLRREDEEPEIVKPHFLGRASCTRLVRPAMRGKTALPAPIFLTATRGRGG